MHHTNGIIARLCILCTLIISLWAFSRTGGLSQNLERSDKQIPLTVHQLQSETGLPVVIVRCEIVKRPVPPAQRSFTCALKNNANKNLTAANLAYSILISTSDNREAEKDRHFLTMETGAAQGFQDLSSPLHPEQESVLGPVEIPYPDTVIKGIDINIDYVEFEDKTTLGPNEAGSTIIADLRKGKAKYKTWLTQEYFKRGKSVAAIVQLLQKDSPIPSDLDFSNFHEETGAKQYRNLLRKKYQTLGSQGIEKHLQK